MNEFKVKKLMLNGRGVSLDIVSPQIIFSIVIIIENFSEGYYLSISALLFMQFVLK